MVRFHGCSTVSTVAVCYQHQIRRPCDCLGRNVSRSASLVPMDLRRSPGHLSAPRTQITESARRLYSAGYNRFCRDCSDGQPSTSHHSKHVGIASDKSGVRVDKISPRCRGRQISLQVSTAWQNLSPERGNLPARRKPRFPTTTPQPSGGTHRSCSAIDEQLKCWKITV